MENTQKIYFKDDSVKWFLAVGSEQTGPFRASEIHARIRTGEITAAHYVWTRGWKKWERICETGEFSALVPEQPAAPPKAGKIPVLPKRPGPTAASGPWFLYFNDSQFGPFAFDEVLRFLHLGKINPRVHAWREGMPDWQRIERIEEFSPTKNNARANASPKGARKNETVLSVELRGSPRKPMVARILLTDQKTLVLGLCRDISLGGMQVLTDKVPGPKGTRVRLNVAPISDAMGIAAFVADGVIVRVLEDGKGFSFRFEKLEADAKHSIERYIQSE